MAKDEERDQDEFDEEPEDEPQDELEEEPEEPEEEASEDEEAEGEEAEEEAEAPKAEERPRRRRKRRKRAPAPPRRVMREEVAPAAPLLVRLARWGLGVGLLVLLAGFIGWLTYKSFGWPVRILLSVGLAVLIGSIVVLGDEALALVKRRATLGTANTAVAALALLGILVLANYVSMRYVNAKWDATSNKRFSLSEQTVTILKNLKEPAQVLAFVNKYNAWGQQQAAQWEDLLSRYADVSRKFTYHIYDTTTDLKALQDNNITRSGVVLVKVGEKKQEASAVSEPAITSALFALTTQGQPKLCFLTGHGERSLDYTQEQTGYSRAKQLLEDQKYVVETLNLQAEKEPEVREGCDVLVILAPKSPLSAKETQAVQNYVNNNGRLFIALDPPPAPGLSQILGEFSVKVEDRVVKDPRSSWDGYGAVPVAQSSGTHQIAEALKGYNLLFVQPRELKTEQPPMPEYSPGMPPPTPATPIVQTSDAASAHVIGKEEAVDQGPLPLVVTATKGEPPPPPMPGQPPPEQKGARLVVAGSGDVASDRVISGLQYVGNQYLWTASFGWLAQREAMVSIPPKDMTPKQFTPTSAQRVLILIFTVFIVPALAAGAGLVVWWRRR
jgi:hypothetical protein